MHRSAIEKKTTLPSSRAQTSDTGPDSTPISGDANLSSRDVPAMSYLQNQEAQPPVKTQEPTIQALQGSASAKNISLGKIESPRQPSTEQVMEPVTRSAPSDAPQGTESGTDSVQPPQEASFDLSSDEKTTMTQDDQVNTLPDGDLSTSQAVGQSESRVSKGINFQKNLEGASTDENYKAQQQIDQSDAESPKYKNNEANGAVRSNISTTFGELQKQPSWPKESMESSEEPERQQQADQATVQ
uniref:Uncharacterized protein n=1 Tax=Arundo donax TaxID=35708 RepID=A0A0A9D5D1_ARUDO